MLGALLVAADFGFAAVAEHQVSQQARKQLDLSDDPGVTIHGFPFTTQALGGEYEHITLSADGVAVQDALRNLELIAELRNVTAPLNDVIEGNTDAIEIGELEGIVKIRQRDVGRLIKLPNLEIEPAAQEFVKSGDPKDEVSVKDLEERRDAMDSFPTTAGLRLATTTRIAGSKTEIVAYGILELTQTSVSIAPHRLEIGHDNGTTVVPPQVRESLLPQFRTTISPGSLPFNVRPSGVAVQQGAVIVQGKANNVTFADGAALTSLK
ncbi:MAG: DUF2993 domain-containing protein [Actinophytocola sp.]|nr:DUF2993 domain-containing protein [Actinophytocola sp.]